MKRLLIAFLACLFMTTTYAATEVDSNSAVGIDVAVSQTLDNCNDTGDSCALSDLDWALADLGLTNSILADGAQPQSCTAASCRRQCFPTGGICTSHGCACF